MSSTGSSGRLLPALEIQSRVIGALILRELHTRFGRDNIGYLWFIVEPMLLAIGITSVHLAIHASLPQGYRIAPFYLSGYVSYMVFRSIVNRATGIVISNKGLMYHQQVTLLDIILARSLLELAACICALTILVGLAITVGLAELPPRPMLVVIGMVTMTWFSTGLGMLICAGGEYSPVVERLVHPATYLALPISGMFFMTEWLAPPLRAMMRWVPLPQIIDIVRVGLFAQATGEDINPGYLLLWCAGTTILGLFALKLARRRMHFE